MIPLTTYEGRRAWALAAMIGGGMAMTVYSAAALYLVRGSVNASLALGLAAHISIIIVLTGFGALLYKRSVKGSAGILSFDSSDQPDPPAAATVTTTTATTVTPATGDPT